MAVDSRALLDRTAQGESRAFAVLFTAQLKPTLARVRPRVGSAALAFDLAAETFAAVVVGAARHVSGDVDAWIADLADHKLDESLEHGRVLAVSRRRLLLGAIVLTDDDLAMIEHWCPDTGATPPTHRLDASDRVVVPGGRRWRAHPAASLPAFTALEEQLRGAVEQAPDVLGLARRSLLRRARA